MARRIIHQLVDDIDGTVLEAGEGETTRFSLDGRAYEIDLSVENAQALRDAIAPFVEAGRKVGASAGRAPGRRGGSLPVKRNVDEVRAWARENGYEVSDRGRISREVQRAYEAR